MFAADLPPWLVRIAAFVFGAVWGSFFNVAIYRWPREMSVVSPPSHCPSCGAPVSPRHNIPIFGWLLLRGRAGCCGTKLSARYPLVELMSALLCVALAERLVVNADLDRTATDAGLLVLAYFAFVGGLVVAAFVDLEWMEIPDEVSLPGAALGLVTATFRPDPGVADAAIGAGLGYLGVQIVFVWAYERLAGRRGMGEGDAKLLLMIGAFLGWQGALFAIVAGAFQGLVAAGIAHATGRPLGPPAEDQGRDASPADDESATGSDEAAKPDAGDEDTDDEPEPEYVGHFKIPYGPFLALGALEFLFFGDRFVEWYLGLLG